MREITHGQIERYRKRAQSLFGAPKYFEYFASRPIGGRRVELKMLRDFMAPTRNAMRRRDRRRATR